MQINEHFRNGLLIRPQRLLYNAVAALAEGLRLGVLTPSPDQVQQSLKRWGKLADVKVVAASPYVNGNEAVQKAALELRDWGADLSILDCIGYTIAMQDAVRELTGKPAILGRGIAARTVKELIG
jgi:protein AroM